MIPDRHGFPIRRTRRWDAGFTLAEVLVCAVIVTIAFVALLSVIPYSSAAVQSGNQTSTATFLANQKLEEAKSIPWTSAPANDCLGFSDNANAAPTVPAGGSCTLGATNVAAGGALPWFADEGSASITSPDGTRHFGGYSRNVRITNCGVGAGCAGIVDPGMRLVTVSVTFTPGISENATAAAPRTITVGMIMAQR
jgi:prepilin-type N-terminal cleavage/methylation domain-containing protein